MPFLVPGAPDRARIFGLELAMRLAPGAEVLLELPLRLVREMGADLDIAKVDERTCRAWARMPSAGRVALGPGLLQVRARHGLRLLVRLPEDARGRRWQVTARQIHEREEEVGRVTWQLIPGAAERRERERNRRPAKRGRAVAARRDSGPGR
jgi:hypothetical protein